MVDPRMRRWLDANADIDVEALDVEREGRHIELGKLLEVSASAETHSGMDVDTAPIEPLATYQGAGVKGRRLGGLCR